MIKYFLAATAALTLAAPIAALAQDVPSYAQTVAADEQLRGRILSFDGGYNLAVRDERGFVDNVQLHDGTIINPTGITLAPGMVVSIEGYNQGPFLSANEIDTPYQIDAGVPYYSGHPWDYYGPSISLAFFFGNTGWWHGNEYGGGFHYDRGARVYANFHEDRFRAFDNGRNNGNAAARVTYGNSTTHAYRATGQQTDRNAAPAYRSVAPAYRNPAPAYRNVTQSYRSAAPAYRAAPVNAGRAPATQSFRGPSAGGSRSTSSHAERGGNGDSHHR
ncbi:MAG: hypothetical protein IAI49_05165 [Candidatus Eremiobacteraeota bacterium]|nr:hypothetical protein [Candidatus Eremiobacteraeota bacterium]